MVAFQPPLEFQQPLAGTLFVCPNGEGESNGNSEMSYSRMLHIDPARPHI